MQRNTNTPRSAYVQSGLSGQNSPGGKKPNRLPRLVRNVALGALALGLLVLLVVLLTRSIGQTAKPVRISAQPSDNIQAFGANLLYYDGMTLHCLAPNGSSNWQYTLGTGGDFSCSQNMVVAWAGTQLHVLNKDGKPTFTDRMTDTIRFARIGDAYVAACIGSDMQSSVRVTTHTGAVLEDESSPFANLYILDIGFVQANAQYMWVLGLDVNGNAPISSLTTYEPGKSSTGGVELQDELVYRIYAHNNMLMVVDTTRIRTFNHKCVEQSDPSPILIYGWQVKQVRAVGRSTYALLEKMPTSSSASTFSELRLVTNYTRQSLRLLSPCFASGLTDKGVYGFGANVIYYAPYGSTTFKTTQLNYTLDSLICVLDGGHAVVVAENNVVILTLPT